jgi:hypothetical protein
MGNALVGGGNFIETIGKLAESTDMIAGHPGRKIPCPQGLQSGKELVKLPVLGIWGGHCGWDFAWRYRL